ncbi:MAG: hypothetical protein OXF75_01060 [Acidimicrobiaceae bacterium]|nr:hypothetical protein [Acidimicrobiaceae bacterium]
MPTTVFAGSQANCRWTGRAWTEAEVVAMSADITERALDLTFERDIAGKLEDLASTGASAEWLTGFLTEAMSRELLPWQVGEAIAETVLENSHGVVIPWNTRRDERNPRASLPGADLVGISDEPEGCRLVFGEVKSSSDTSSPPGVVTGRSGIVQQLERLIDDETLRFSLIRWLFARVDDDAIGASFDEALAAFVSTCGSSVRLVGMLVRDTPANERDVNLRGRALGERVSAPGSVELHAMYMPRPMDRWVEWVAA